MELNRLLIYIQLKKIEKYIESIVRSNVTKLNDPLLQINKKTSKDNVIEWIQYSHLLNNNKYLEILFESTESIKFILLGKPSIVFKKNEKELKNVYK